MHEDTTVFPTSSTWWKVWSCQFSGAYALFMSFMPPLPCSTNMGGRGYQTSFSPLPENIGIYLTWHSGNCAVRKQVKWAHMEPSNERTVKVCNVAIFYFTQIKRKKSFVGRGKQIKLILSYFCPFQNIFVLNTVNKFMLQDVNRMYIFFKKIHFAK